MNFNAFIYLFFTILKFSYSTLTEQCTKANSFWESLKYPYLNVLPTYTLQSVTPIKCPSLSTNTCCNSGLLKEMSSISELKLKGFSEEKIEFLLTMLSNDSYVLMNMILNDLDNTKHDLNLLFIATYGFNYKVHKLFFITWFDKLKSYMEGKIHNIGQLLDDFFLEMAEKIVKILIPPETSPEITKCHVDRLIEAKPYQDSDIGLKNKIIRSYPPARLFVNGIAVGRDVFKRLMKKTIPTGDCYEKFNTLFHCMLCNGLTIKPCPNTCKNIMENCFGSFKSADLKKFDRVFNKYLKSLITLAGRLENPFNFPTVNHKMNVQISTAIMNVQNLYPTLKEQIKAKCLKSAGLQIRKKRQAAKEFISWQNVEKNSQPKPWWEKNLESNLNPNPQKKNSLPIRSNKLNDFLSPIARTIKTKYKSLEKYFSTMSLDFCSVSSASPTSVECWNGTSLAKTDTKIEKNIKKKTTNKNLDIIIKAASNQLNDVTFRINSFLEGKVADPETFVVEDYKLHNPKPEIKLAESRRKTSDKPVLEGSGDFEKLPINEPLLPPNKIEPKPFEPSPVGVPTQGQKKINTAKKPDKDWQFPSFPEGSGDAEIKKPEFEKIKTQKPIVELNINKTNKKTTIPSSKITSTSSSVEKRMNITNPNPNPDDEDETQEFPAPVVNQVITTTTAVPIIQPEGSGSDPDVIAPKPKVPVVITTTKKPELPDKSIEGSGNEVEPKPDGEKSFPSLPKSPDSPDISTASSKTKKPVVNPDEEQIEGSGKAPIEVPLPSKPQTFTESPSTPKKVLPPDQFPGSIPSEVWIPSLEKANSEKDNHKTTPGSSAYKNHRSIISTTCLITLSLFLIYYLP